MAAVSGAEIAATFMVAKNEFQAEPEKYTPQSERSMRNAVR